MLKQIQQVLRLLMLMRQKRKHEGGLLVLLWTEEAAVQRLSCTIAAAGPWCKGIKMEDLQSVLLDLKDRLFPSTGPCPEPDPEELCAFTDLYGSLRLLVSFQMDVQLSHPELQECVEMFFQTFSLPNARIKIHLKLKLNQKTLQREFRVKLKRTVLLAEKRLELDVSCSTHFSGCLKSGRWCHGGHPVVGNSLPLSIPPQSMDEGLYGMLSLQPVTLLHPCVLQFPNLPTRLTHIQVLVYSPSNVPVTGSSAFFQELPAHLDCHELGLRGLYCSSFQDLVYCSGTVYRAEQVDCEDPDDDSSLRPLHQSLTLFLFLRHSDPFTSQLSDFMVTEMLIERHLEDILNNNRQAVIGALQTVLKKALKTQLHRHEDQDKMHSAGEVILSSCISIVSSSSNMEFRNACLNSMKVNNTHDLSAALRQSLRRVTSWKYTPRGVCYSTEVNERLKNILMLNPLDQKYVEMSSLNHI